MSRPDGRRPNSTLPTGGDAVLEAGGRGLSFPYEPPRPGRAVEVADGVLWMRLPAPGSLEYVNIYALDDGSGWTLVDCGQHDGPTAESFAALRTGPLRRKPITRLILTHHHPDHAGQTAALVAEGVEVWASRACWLSLRAFSQERPTSPTPSQLAVLARSGWPQERLAAYAAGRPFDYGAVAPTPPQGYRRLTEGQTLAAADRVWRVRLGGGHAPEHVTLWSEDGALALVADQALPATSANVGVDSDEPWGDPIADWLESCARLGALADDRRLTLPGHDRPYLGLAFRLRQIAEKHHAALARLREALTERPSTAADLLTAMYGRPIADAEFGHACVETLAHLLHLRARGEAECTEGSHGELVFQLKSRGEPPTRTVADL